MLFILGLMKMFDITPLWTLELSRRAVEGLDKFRGRSGVKRSTGQGQIQKYSSEKIKIHANHVVNSIF